MLDSISNSLQTISRKEGEWSSFMIYPLLFIVVYEVFMRYAFNAPTTWGFEATTFLYGLHYMFGMAYCLRVGGHIRVDFLYDNLGRKGKSIVDILGYLILMLPVTIWITYGLFEYTMEAYVSQEQSGESAWNPLIWPFRAVWAIGCLALVLQGVSELLKAFLAFSGRPFEENLAPEHSG